MQMSAAYTHGQIVDNELTNHSYAIINIFILPWVLGNVN